MPQNPSPPSIQKVHHGRTRSIQRQVQLWRKRNATYNALKQRIMHFIVQERGIPTEQAAAWFKTPNAAFKGKTPREMMNPTNIRWLYRVVRRTFLPVDNSP